MAPALSVEVGKLRRSYVVLVASVLQVLLVPLLAFALVRVAATGGVGVLAGKSQALVAGTGWDAYLGALGQIAAAGLFVGTGVVVSWIFGREHAEGTFGALFACAVPRRAVARAKILATSAWVVVVAGGVLGVAVLVGVMGGVGEGRTLPPANGLGRSAAVILFALLLTLPIGLVASVGRGYLPAIGAVIVIVAAAQILVVLGVGGWFPFAVPGLLAVASEEVVAAPGPAQLALAGLTPLVGAWATIRWWARAEVV